MTLSKGKIRKCNESNGVLSDSVSGSCRACRDKDAHRSLTSNDETMTETIEKSDEDARKHTLSNRHVVHVLVVVFGISAWIGVNGIYVQLPLLVASAPEAWNLAAYLVVIIQAANVGPAVYTIAKKCYPSLDESLCVFGLLLTGTLSMGLLAFLYDKTSLIDGAEHSATLFVCAFFTALVGCTSSVLFMPYLRNYNQKYLAYYFIGEGLSGVLPSVVAFFQGVGGETKCRRNQNGDVEEISSEPRFSPRSYFIFIFSILLLSLCTFRLLRYLPSLSGENPSLTSELSGPRDDKEQCVNGENFVPAKVEDKNGVGPARTVYFHILLGLVCLMGNGFLPGVQTYSCLPYGKIAFHLSVTLANVANPAACVIYLWSGSVNPKFLDALSFLGFLTCTYAVYLAAMSPIPPMRDTVLGATLAVLAWIALTGIISYLKLSITSTVRQRLGPRGLLGVGVVMQLGSACGALVSFGLINYTTLFRQHKPCTTL